MMILIFIAIAALITADQLVKLWAVKDLMPVGSMDFIKLADLKILDLTYVENRGAIFGSMSGHKWFLVGFTSIIIIICIGAIFKFRNRSKLLSWAIALFVAGGIGNLIDRIRLGYVVDMFDIKLFKFAVFNVADICVTFAFVMLFIYVLFIDPKIEKQKKAAAQNTEKTSDE